MVRIRRGAGHGKSEEDGPCKKERGNRRGRAARDGASLYVEKAAVGAMQRALPERGTPTPMGPRFAWKPESALVSPGRTLSIDHES